MLFSEIQYRISVDGCELCFHSGAFLLDNLLEDFGCKLLALVVADDANLYLLFVAEELVIVHLTGDECVGTLSNGFVEEERSCPTAQGHALYLSAQQLVGLHTLHPERAFKVYDEVVGSL